MDYLTPDFFSRDVLTVAQDLIGVELVWQGASGIIVETEAYAVEGDRACHTATRPSTREFVKNMPPGAAYVYFNYGMYWLFNLLAKGGPKDGLVLIRALEPVRGIEQMRQRRQRDRLEDLCSGPGKLTVALGIGGVHNGMDMTGQGRPFDCGLKPGAAPREILTDVRVGISQAADYPWRFLAKDSRHVSVRHGSVKPTKVRSR